MVLERVGQGAIDLDKLAVPRCSAVAAIDPERYAARVDPDGPARAERESVTLADERLAQLVLRETGVIRGIDHVLVDRERGAQEGAVGGTPLRVVRVPVTRVPSGERSFEPRRERIRIERLLFAPIETPSATRSPSCRRVRLCD